MRKNRSLKPHGRGVVSLAGQVIVNLRLLRALVVMGLAGAVTVVALAQAAQAVAPIKTMSFNIRFDNGTPSTAANAWIATSGTNRRDLALSVISSYGPDILGVQEALNNQVNDLKNGLPQHNFYGVGRDDGATSGEYSGIFYRGDRFTRTNQGTFWLSSTPDTPSFFPGTCCRRIASWAILQDTQAGNQEYFVLNTHWDHQVQAAREYSAQLIRDRIGLLSGGRPLIMMGDLNSTETNVAYLNLIGSNDPGGLQLLDSYREVVPVQQGTEATFNGFVGTTFGSRIDFVFHDDFFQATEASIVRTSFSGRYPSDHYPVTAVLQLPFPAGDFDFDGDVDGRDFLAWQRAGSPDPLSSSDLATWQNSYGTNPLVSALRLPPSTLNAAVPEPSAGTFGLFALALALRRRLSAAYHCRSWYHSDNSESRKCRKTANWR